MIGGNYDENRTPEKCMDVHGYFNSLDDNPFYLTAIKTDNDP
jgi:esterase/lipase superfamily enzyme